MRTTINFGCVIADIHDYGPSVDAHVSFFVQPGYTFSSILIGHEERKQLIEALGGTYKIEGENV